MAKGFAVKDSQTYFLCFFDGGAAGPLFSSLRLETLEINQREN